VPYDQGVSDWRVYAAEQSVGYDRDVNLEECQDILDEARSSDWWQDWFPYAPPIEVEVGGHEYPDVDVIGSHAQPHDRPRRSNWTISLHPKMMTARVLLHGIAHCVAPHYVSENGDRRRSGSDRYWERRNHLTHGACFAGAMSVITDYMLPSATGELAVAYEHFEAPVATPEELREQLVAQPAIIDDEEEFYAEIERQQEAIDARYVAEHGKQPEWKIPVFTWGDNIEFRRRDRRGIDGRMISQRRLAEHISQVMPCSPRHISMLEKSDHRPEEPDQLKRAMLATIVLGFDPIWTRYNLGLNRWDCGGITMKQARLMNGSWYKLVSRMNKQLRGRPPRWSVEGGR
jgi:hypothetical protein